MARRTQPQQRDQEQQKQKQQQQQQQQQCDRHACVPVGRELAGRTSVSDAADAEPAPACASRSAALLVRTHSSVRKDKRLLCNAKDCVQNTQSLAVRQTESLQSG